MCYGIRQNLFKHINKLTKKKMQVKKPENGEDYLILIIEGVAIYIISATGEIVGRFTYDLAKPYLEKWVFPVFRRMIERLVYFITGVNLRGKSYTVKHVKK